MRSGDLASRFRGKLPRGNLHGQSPNLSKQFFKARLKRCNLHWLPANAKKASCMSSMYKGLHNMNLISTSFSNKPRFLKASCSHRQMTCSVFRRQPKTPTCMKNHTQLPSPSCLCNRERNLNTAAISKVLLAWRHSSVNGAIDTDLRTLVTMWDRSLWSSAVRLLRSSAVNINCFAPWATERVVQAGFPSMSLVTPSLFASWASVYILLESLASLLRCPAGGKDFAEVVTDLNVFDEPGRFLLDSCEGSKAAISPFHCMSSATSIVEFFFGLWFHSRRLCTRAYSEFDDGSSFIRKHSWMRDQFVYKDKTLNEDLLVAWAFVKQAYFIRKSADSNARPASTFSGRTQLNRFMWNNLNLEGWFKHLFLTVRVSTEIIVCVHFVVE